MCDRETVERDIHRYLIIAKIIFFCYIYIYRERETEREEGRKLVREMVVA